MGEIINYLRGYFQLKGIFLDENSPLRQQLSSLGIVELACDIEDVFAIEIPDSDIKILGNSIVEIAKYIEERKKRNLH